LGVIAFALLFGKPPFETNEVKTTYEKIKVCDYSFPKTIVSPTAKNFIGKMLKLNPADRSTIDQLLADDFLSRKEIPRTLPLSTLACPPSKAFLEQVKNDHRAPSESKFSHNDEFDGLNTSRTDKHDKFNCLLAS
jgi:polo-like kinase 1